MLQPRKSSGLLAATFDFLCASSWHFEWQLLQKSECFSGQGGARTPQVSNPNQRLAWGHHFTAHTMFKALSSLLWLFLFNCSICRKCLIGYVGSSWCHEILSVLKVESQVSELLWSCNTHMASSVGFLGVQWDNLKNERKSRG